VSGRRRALGLWLVLLLALAAAAAPATAGPFEDGLEAADQAHSRGDYAEAVKLWRPLAEQGDAYAQYNLGIMYKYGRGVPQDYAEAARWYRLAADQGNARAQNNLGFMYSNGLGVAQDYAEAVRWLRLAADQGDAFAQNWLGLMYELGRGVPQDYAEAVRWYRLAADQGNSTAWAAIKELAGNDVAQAKDIVRDRERWSWQWDSNGDRKITISDIFLWFGWVFHAPWDAALVVFLDSLPDVAGFFEMDRRDYGGWISLIVSIMFWLVSLILLGRFTET